MPTEAGEGALVLFSGGQDSTTCLAWALAHYLRVETIGFGYGQRHAVELKQRPMIREKLARLQPQWGQRLGEDHTIDLSALGRMSDTAMTRNVEITFGKKGLPSTFVPGRNIMFLTFAAALAYRRGLKHIIGGMCETDFSGYPDCRDDTIKALQVALNLGMESRFVIETPLMWLDSAARRLWALSSKTRTHVISANVASGTSGAMVAAPAQLASCVRGDGRSGGVPPDRTAEWIFYGKA
jgi:7-cyano-7-deazaguanine synthase